MRRLIGLFIVMALILSAGGTQLSSGNGGSSYTASTSNNSGSLSVSTTGQTTSTSSVPGSTTPAGGGGNNYVCSKNGLPISTSVNSKGYLTIQYAGSAIGLTPQDISGYQQYASCVTSAQQKIAVNCSVVSTMAGAAAYLKSCHVKLNIIPVKWTGAPGSSPANPGTLVNIPAITQSCEASFNPGVQASKVKITGVNVLPSAKWLLNLPVEYAYSDSARPTVSFSGSTGTSCHVAIGKKISGAVSVGASGLTYNVTPGQTTVQMVLYGSNTPVGPSQSCNYHNNALVPPSQIPDYQGNLPAYQSFFQGRRICTFTPSGTSFQSVAFNKTPIQFYITRSWTVNYSYTESSSVSVTQSGKTQNVGGSSTTVSNSIPVTATFRSPGPIRVMYIVGQECSFVSGTVSCPQSNG